MEEKIIKDIEDLENSDIISEERKRSEKEKELIELIKASKELDLKIRKLTEELKQK